MPYTLKVELSDERIAELNAEGVARGVHACPKCKHSLHWKPAHDTEYFEGEEMFVRSNRRGGESRRRVPCVKSVRILCQDCWAALTVEERVTVYQDHLMKRTSIEMIRPPAIKEVDGMKQVDQGDAERHRKEMTVATSDIDLIMAAVRGGK